MREFSDESGLPNERYSGVDGPQRHRNHYEYLWTSRNEEKTRNSRENEQFYHGLESVRKELEKISFLASDKKKESLEPVVAQSFLLVRVTGFEPTASWSRTKRATSCATPGKAFTSIRGNPMIWKIKAILLYFLLVLMSRGIIPISME